MVRIQKRDLWRIILRSFFIQGSWNYERMLALGFCFCILPVARRLYKTREERAKFLHRHLEFFNAHPYMASYALGAVAKLEEQACSQKWPDSRPISVFKERICGPLGAIGDTLFWSLIKPLTAIIGVAVALVYGVIGVAVFLLLYNVPHLCARVVGVFKSYRQGFDVVRGMSMRRFQRYFETLMILGAGGLGLLGAMGGRWTFSQGQESGLAFIIAVVISFVLAIRRVPVNLILVILIGTAVLMGLIKP